MNTNEDAEPCSAVIVPVELLQIGVMQPVTERAWSDYSWTLVNKLNPLILSGDRSFKYRLFFADYSPCEYLNFAPSCDFSLTSAECFYPGDLKEAELRPLIQVDLTLTGEK